MTPEIAEFILNMRTAAGLSRKTLASQLCLSVSTLDAYERGEKEPVDPDKFLHDLREVVKQEIRKQREYKNTTHYLLVG